MTKLHILKSNSVKPLSKLPANTKKENLFKNKNILLFSPHSDDISISIGGIVTALAKSNQIKPVLLFSGYRGVKNKSKQEATKIRQNEMEKESKFLGIDSPFFLKLSSYNQIPHTPNINKIPIKEDCLKVKNVLKENQPDIIFLPQKNDNHPSHKLGTKIILNALKGYKNSVSIQLIFYENPWSLFENLEFNLVFFFSKKELNKKIKAVRAHRSQLKRTPFDKACRSLSEFRASTIPEQRIVGYGKTMNHLGQFYAEVFNWKNKE